MFCATIYCEILLIRMSVLCVHFNNLTGARLSMTNKKKDILFLCQFFYPEYVTAATLSYDIATELAKNGHTVDVLCGYPGEYSNGRAFRKYETVSSIKIHRLKYIQKDRRKKLDRVINYFSFTVSVLLRFFSFRNYRAVVVSSNPPVLPIVAAWAKKRYGTKLVFIGYDIYPEIALRTGTVKKNGIICKAMRRVNRRVFPLADRVVVLSREMKEFLINNRKTAPEKIVVQANWYEDKKGHAETFDRAVTDDNVFYDEYHDKFVVSYFGNMGTCQDIDTLIGAARLLRERDDIVFMFAGHGNKVAGLKETAEKDGLANIRVYDFLHGKDYTDALYISDCAAVSLNEGLSDLCSPSKTYAYMMAQLPVIAIMEKSDITSELCENDAGFAVENGQSERLADIVTALAASPERCAQMGRNCRRLYLKKYTKVIGTGGYVRLFDGLLGDESDKHHVNEEDGKAEVGNENTVHLR